MMRPAEAEILEDGVWVAGKVAIGEEKQFCVGQQLGVRLAHGLGGRTGVGSALDVQRLCQRVIYVSHVDLIFGLR
jgi:hypothetical protein